MTIKVFKEILLISLNTFIKIIEYYSIFFIIIDNHIIYELLIINSHIIYE
jgi:hypothetical protein